MKDGKSTASESKPSGINQIGLLADAPLFIDSATVSSFYDAVVRPEYENGVLTLDFASAKSTSLSGKASGELDFGLRDWITSVFPFLQATVKAKGEADAEVVNKNEQKRSIELHPISTPQRQLVQLALHYSANQTDRLLFLDSENLHTPILTSRQFVAEIPRALVFLDLLGREDTADGVPPLMFIPLAAEFSSGEVILLFERLKSKDGRTLPPAWRDYPSGVDIQEIKSEHDGYWRWFEENFSPSTAIRSVEEASNGRGRLHWIDYRVPVRGTAFHLHICPAEKYDIGVFAFNLIKRGAEHGIRIVGALKSGLDINVLAIFEK